jgi:N-methylhydantoinase A
MPLDVDAAHRSLAGLGGRIGVDAVTAARGVLRYVVAQMSHALRLVTLRRGHDPRDFTFVAFGGAGPLHAALLARELGVARTVIPPAPGHFSALGMLLGDLRADAVRTHVGSLEPSVLRSLFDSLEVEAAAELEREAGGHRTERFARLRYVGQEHTLEVPLGDDPIDHDLLERLRKDFDDASEEAYAFRLPTAIEIVEARVSVSVARGEPVEWAAAPAPLPSSGRATSTWTSTAGCSERRSSNDERSTPAIGSPAPASSRSRRPTVLVLPGQSVTLDELSNLVIEEDA